MFDRVPGLYSLVSSSTPPSWNKQKYLRALLNVPWRATGSPVEKHCSRYTLPIFGNKIFWLHLWLSGKEPACQCRKHKRRGFNPWVGKIPWGRKRQPTPVFLPGESHGLRSLVGYTVLRVAKSWTQLEQLSIHTCTRNVGSSLTRD